jgi:hypothetical protein
MRMNKITVKRLENGTYMIAGEDNKKEAPFKTTLSPEAFKVLVRVRHLRPGTSKVFKFMSDAGVWEPVA